jgi:hypothetical protein
MKKLDITIIKNAQRETATLELDRTTSTLSITFADGMQKTYSDTDIYTCLGLKIRKFSEITFLCKGSKINVYPSAMVSQISSGVVAYEVTMGDPMQNSSVYSITKKTTSQTISMNRSLTGLSGLILYNAVNTVHIFDYEEENLTNDSQEQIDLF